MKLTENEMLILEKQHEKELPEIARKAWGEAYEETILTGRPVIYAEKIRGVLYIMEKRLIKKAECEIK